ncbi:capsule assembly Wzi family protein [Candidatus Marinimicrobia bacterium]|nr:capsule assembly Wzi family protein [Candidatus Neomarinimicrobiota bacterium]
MKSSNKIIIWVLLLSFQQALASNYPIIIKTTSNMILNSGFNPFWHRVNKMGAFSNKQLFSFSSFSDNKFLVGYGFTSIFYPSKMQRSFLQIGFLYKRINDYELKVGRWEQKITSESSLSTGSLIRGTNSIPIPQISLMMTEYKKYKIFNNEIWIKGGFTHGWFSKGEYIKAPYLHEKYLYIKKYINEKSEFNLGLVHEAIWGGTTYIHGLQPGTFEDYFRVVFARPASSSGFIGEQTNVLGNHLGIWDLSYSKKNLKREIKLYYQHPFEDKSGAFQYFFDELKKRSITRKSFDGLFGIEIKNNISSLITLFLYEYINTTHQSGSNPQSETSYGWDSYYNHYIYLSGWSYKGDILSNPLFTEGRLTNEGDYISNNRIKAHHIGLSGVLSKNIKHKLLLTYSKNYGTYWDQVVFLNSQKQYKYTSALEQFSALFELDILNVFNNTNITISYAFDNGQVLKDNQSFQLSFFYNFNNLSYSQ